MSETLARTEARAVGFVTAHTSRHTYSAIDNRPEVLFFPSVRFQTADSRTIEFENNLGSNAPPRIGDEVTVLYDPARPEKAKARGGEGRPGVHVEGRPQSVTRCGSDLSRDDGVLLSLLRVGDRLGVAGVAPHDEGYAPSPQGVATSRLAEPRIRGRAGPLPRPSERIPRTCS